jgi:hypothetical protein
LSKVDELRALGRRPLFSRAVTDVTKPVTDKPKPVTDAVTKPQPLAVAPQAGMTNAERQAKWRASHPDLARALDRDRKRVTRSK